MKKSFVDTIIMLMEEQKITQVDLARMSGISQSSISDWLRGKYLPKQDKVDILARALNVSPAYLMGWEKEHKKGVKIPVLGHIQAGIPVEAIEDILDWEEIDEQVAKSRDYFCLQVRGKSMQPKFSEGDVVVVRQQSDVDSGQIAIVLVNGEDATIKQIQKFNGGITLVPFNNAYPTQTYTNKEIKSLPVTILGRVVELRAKF